MKKLLIVAFLFGSAFSVCAQITLSSGSQLVVASGSYLVVNDVVNTSGTIDNSGTVTINGDITNNGGGLFDSGSTGTVTFAGSSAQEVTGTASVHYYGTLNINNSNGVSFTNTSTGADQEIHGTLGFTSGKLTLNGFNLTLAGTADPTGVGATAYIVTNSTGQLKRTVAASDILFPVGNAAYNPITLNNAGTSDIYGVKVVDSKPTSFTGTEHIVNRSWDVTEANSGNSNLTVTTQWNSGEEEATFDRTTSSMGITTDAGANVTWGASGAATGSNPYVHSQAGYTGVGSFMLGDYTYGGLVIDLQAFLAGAYNTTNHNMDKTLNTESLLQLTDPYSLSTTVSSIPTDAVDWVKIEFRDSGDNTSILYSVARFIDQSGQVIEEDGTDCMLTGVPSGTYYIAIVHRNHFGIMSASTINLSSSPTLSFKGVQATAYQNGAISTNAAMAEVETDVFGLWNGDANGDGIVRYDGTDNDRGVILNSLPNAGATESGYASTDVNMDGITRYDGTNADRGVILNLLPNAGATYYQHLP